MWSEETYESGQLLIWQLCSLKTALLHLSCRHIASLNFAENAQHEALHVRILVKDCIQLRDGKLENLKFRSQSLSELLLVLFKSQSPLILALSGLVMSSATILST